jgi:DNA-binding CsgD family transcriptional regulator
MSPKEKETLTLLARGYPSVEIADCLGVTPNYIYSLIRLLKARFGTRTNAGIVSHAIAEGIITADGTFTEEEAQILEPIAHRG